MTRNLRTFIPSGQPDPYFNIHLVQRDNGSYAILDCDRMQISPSIPTLTLANTLWDIYKENANRVCRMNSETV